MKLKILNLVCVITLGSLSHHALASGEHLRKQNVTTENNLELIADTKVELKTLIKSLNKYYQAKEAWPSSIANISKYYNGDFNTPFGKISGTQTLNGYSVSVVTSGLSGNVLANLSSMVKTSGGSMSGSTIRYDLDAPVSMNFTDKALSRYTDASGEKNKMYANILMNGHDLNNVQNAGVKSAEFDTAKISNSNLDAVSITNSVVDKASLNVLNVQNQAAQDVTITRANLATELTVASAFTVGTLENDGVIAAGGHVVINNDGKVFYEGEDLDTRYLGLGVMAQNATRLDNILAANFARNDKSNVFNGTNTITRNASASTTKSTNVRVKGNAHTNQVNSSVATIGNAYVGNEWASSTYARVDRNTINLDALSRKFNVSGSFPVGHWRFVTRFGYHNQPRGQSDFTAIVGELCKKTGQNVVNAYHQQNSCHSDWTSTQCDNYNRPSNTFLYGEVLTCQ
ncbi:MULTISPECIES: hypothetical protein [Vibrio]|uniref:Uncharacterized protein n=1 Tax=Vibrio tasmaniensis TaxID=212663 RepID=A0A2N7NCV5_9VIBR|nr:hypothetical protein [Vibrio tasmaniensis]PMO89818.1 hypothetical protein BCT01_00620 [Vibrio tasmaniensis]PMP10009.1 hypothetical protein BCS92_02470 [Vibrio tasmaniensis]TKG32606.1 hypothetical protein FC057_12380 [Vibrio tasmaniensis]TKG41710.1 hypothetical protein FC063_07560 [Vibrio tasmaniensis]TKG52065.1 hypothetical protein FC070_09830 [Vibrio tasmaniensis]